MANAAVTYERLKHYYRLKSELSELFEREPMEGELNDAIHADPALGITLNVRDFETFDVDDEEDEQVELRFRMGVSNMNLVNARKAKGFDQRQVADLLGLSPQSYGPYETCKKYPDYETRQKISSLLGKSQEYLFPKWMQIFTEKWKRMEKEKTVFMRTESLTSPEVAGLLSSPSSMQESIDNEMLRAKLTSILKDLNQREQEILSLRYGLKDGVAHSLDEVAREFDVTGNRIMQIEWKALEKIKQHPDIKLLDSFRDGAFDGTMMTDDKREIDSMSYEDMLRRQRTAPSGHRFFVANTEVAQYFSDRMRLLRSEVGEIEHVRISKKIGWGY